MTLADNRHTPPASRLNFFRKAPALIDRWRKRRQIMRDYRVLRRMSADGLRDIGLTRDDIDWAEGRARQWLDLDRRP